MFIAAMGAGAFYKSVRQKPLILLAIWKAYILSVDVAVLVDLCIELLSEPKVCGVLGSRVVVEMNVVGV